jgi:nicotinic acid mononucleotide adenylyltransferase
MADDKKKTKEKTNKEVSNFVDIDPIIAEARAETIVISFGRFSPPTLGHEQLVTKVAAVAKNMGADASVFATHSYDKKKNPLSYISKIKYLQKAFGRIIKNSPLKTIIDVAKDLSDNYDNIVIVVGSDRVTEFETLLNKYNGKEYNFDSIEVVSAGVRDPDSDDITGMSASKLRSVAVDGDLEAFRKGLPTKLKADAQKIYDELRKNMNASEELDEDMDLEERAPLTVSQRRARGRTMRRYSKRIAMAKKRAARRKATPEKLKTRSRKKAREILKTRLAAGKKYSEMTPAEKVQLDKRLMRIPDTTISRIATRQLPAVRKGEMERLARVRGGANKSNENINEKFEAMLNEMCLTPRKRFHQALTKEGQVKFDGRFKLFRKKKQEQEPELEEMFNEEFLNEAKELMNLVDKSNPENREEGSDSLVKILKKDTPGQNESYYDSRIGSDFGNFRLGGRVGFTDHSMDMVGNNNKKQGTVVGTNAQHLRVRDDTGMLHLVRHSDADLLENINDKFDSMFLKGK